MYLHTRLLLGIGIVTLFVLGASLFAPLLFVRAEVSRETVASLRLARVLLDIERDARAAQGSEQARAAAARDVRGACHLRHVNITLLDAAGMPIAVSPPDAPPGGWLARSLLAGGSPRAITYALGYRGATLGTLRVFANPLSEMAEIEQRVAAETVLLALAVLAMTISIYSIVRSGLRPVGRIQAALAALAGGALDTRLPVFRLKDLAEIARRFNRCAAALQEAAAERRELTRRLINVEEEERKRLARELHDELGQSLTAIQVDAAYIVREAAGRSPQIEACAREVEHLTRQIMELIRSMLARLRPHGLETVGLREALEDLVSGWQARVADRFGCSLTIDGSVDGLPSEINITIYRLVQECLTNAVRHSRARTISIRIAVDAQKSADRCGRVTVSVWEAGADGSAPPAGCSAPLTLAGAGLLGMRERVEALGGELIVQRTDSAVVLLTAWMPLHAPPREASNA